MPSLSQNNAAMRLPNLMYGGTNIWEEYIRIEVRNIVGRVNRELSIMIVEFILKSVNHI